MTRHLRILALLSLGASAGLASACSCGDPSLLGDAGGLVGDGDTGDTVGDGDTGDGDTGDGDTGDGDVGDGDGDYTLQIEPQPAELVATVGGTETLQLTAVLVDAAGNRTPAANPFWGSLDPAIGTVDSAGLFVPSRERAGLARVRARADGIEGVGDVEVILHEDLVLEGDVGPGDFDGPVGAGPGPAVLYPFDQVVIPANLAPILFQWDKVKSQAHVLLSGEGGSLELFTTGQSAQAPTDAWRRFLIAHIGGSIDVVVEESEGPGTERVATQLTLLLADADLTSTVYYWAVDQGRVVRIDADSLQPLSLDIPFDNSPEGGVPAGENEQQCRACHTLSADGQRMAFTYFGGNGPGGVIDTGDVGNPVLSNRDDRRWNYAALNPDGSLLVTNLNRRIMLRSGLTGDPFPGFEDLTNIDTAMPVFSPVGDRIAYAGNIRWPDGSPVSWEIDFERSDLYVLDILGDDTNPAIGTPSMLVPGGEQALYYPSFSPDGTLLAYTAGPHSRSNNNDVNLPGELWVADADATPDVDGVPRIKLERANPNDDSYLPTFNPKVEGGYLWIAFFSRRDYGHVIRGEERPQIWVAAVDEGADPAAVLADPSHPAFWLPGQNADTDNLSSYFAPKPCAGTGGACSSDSGCCFDLLCRPVGDEQECVPPEDACLLQGDQCAMDDECCEGLLCAPTSEGGPPTCRPPGEVCSAEGQPCQLDADCCEGAGFCVDDGVGTTRCLTDSPGDCAPLGGDCSTQPCCEGQGTCLSDTCASIGG